MLHIAPRIGGPQRRPAGAHRGEECRLVVDAEEALELAGEVRALAIFDQRRGAHRTRCRVFGALRVPGGKQSVKNVWRNRLLVEAEANFDRQSALLHEVCFRVTIDGGVQPECGNLRPVGIRAQAEPARCRQPGMGQRREVRGLRPDAVGIGCSRGRKRNDELFLAHNSTRARLHPLSPLAGRGSG